MAKRRTQPIAGIGALVIAVALGTAVVLAADPPETTAVAVSYEGLEASAYGATAPEVGSMSLEPRPDVEALGVGPAYELSLGGLPVPSGFFVGMTYDPEALNGVAPNRLSVFAYDRDADAWVALASVVDPAARSVVAESNGVNATLWTLGAR